MRGPWQQTEAAAGRDPAATLHQLLLHPAAASPGCCGSSWFRGRSGSSASGEKGPPGPIHVQQLQAAAVVAAAGHINRSVGNRASRRMTMIMSSSSSRGIWETATPSPAPAYNTLTDLVTTTPCLQAPSLPMARRAPGRATPWKGRTNPPSCAASSPTPSTTCSTPSRSRVRQG